jgi:hypothetical protein
LRQSPYSIDDEGKAPMTEPRLQMLGISKIYPSVVANAEST